MAHHREGKLWSERPLSYPFLLAKPAGKVATISQAHNYTETAMSFPEAMMHDRIWFDRPKYVEAREHYELFLTNNLTLQVSKSHEPILSKETKAVAKV